MNQNVSLAELLISTIATTCNLDPATLDLQTQMSDLGVDSLSLFSIVTQIGMICGVEFTLEETIELFEVTRIEDAIALVQRITSDAYAGL